MSLVYDIKPKLRITTDDPEIIAEVQDLIDECKADLQLAGVEPTKIIDTDPLIKRAVTTYCKAYFGYDNPDADRLRESYNAFKAHLTLSADYKAVVVVEA